jgi:hypothetical protein
MPQITYQLEITKDELEILLASLFHRKVFLLKVSTHTSEKEIADHQLLTDRLRSLV